MEEKRVDGERLFIYGLYLLKKKGVLGWLMKKGSFQSVPWPDGFQQSSLFDDLKNSLVERGFELKKAEISPTLRDAARVVWEVWKKFIGEYGLERIDVREGVVLEGESEMVGFDDRWMGHSPFYPTHWLATQSFRCSQIFSRPVIGGLRDGDIDVDRWIEEWEEVNPSFDDVEGGEDDAEGFGDWDGIEYETVLLD